MYRIIINIVEDLLDNTRKTLVVWLVTILFCFLCTTGYFGIGHRIATCRRQDNGRRQSGSKDQ